MLSSTSFLPILAVLIRLAFAQITLAPRQANEQAAAACSTAGAILIKCESATPGYDGLSPQSQASCACSPVATVFDNSINTCLAFLSGQPSLAATYSTALPFSSLCARNAARGSTAIAAGSLDPGGAVSTTFATSSTTDTFPPLQTTPPSSGKGSGTIYPAAQSKGLSTGAKAGAAVGGVLGGLALLVIGFFAARFKIAKKEDKQPSPSTAELVSDDKAHGTPNFMRGNPAGPVSPLRNELSGTSSLKPHEMPATITPVYELGTKPAPAPPPEP